MVDLILAIIIVVLSVIWLVLVKNDKIRIIFPSILAVLWVIRIPLQTQLWEVILMIGMTLFCGFSALLSYSSYKSMKKFQKEMDEEVRKAREEANEMVEKLK